MHQFSRLWLYLAEIEQHGGRRELRFYMWCFLILLAPLPIILLIVIL